MQKVYSNWAKENNNGSLNSKDWGLVQLGANWQKEQSQPLIDSHRELLGWVIKLRELASVQIPEFNIPELNDSIEKANNINH